MGVRKKPPTPTLPAASPADLLTAKLALGEKLPTVAGKIKSAQQTLGIPATLSNKEFLQESPKQVKTREQLEKDFQRQCAALLKEQEEDARRDTFEKTEIDDDDSKRDPIYYDLGNIGYELGDEEPITKVVGFNVPDSALRFQKYQFDPQFNRSGGSQTVKWDDKHALGPMIEPSSWGTIRPYSVAAGSMIASQSENELKQYQKKGMRIMDAYFNFIGQPRQAEQESAWIFDDTRWRDFIIRQIENEDVNWYGQNPKADLDEIAWRFARALKTYFGLYHFFRGGMSDKEISDAEGSTIPVGLWRKGRDGADIAARTKDRARMMEAGFELYGCGPVGKLLDPNTVERSACLWPFFEEVRREVARGRRPEDEADEEGKG